MMRTWLAEPDPLTVARRPFRRWIYPPYGGIGWWPSTARLGDATRLEVFRLIAAQTSPLCVCDIVDRFDVSQPTISHHLKILRDAGLVTVSRRGVWAYYAVDPGRAGAAAWTRWPTLFPLS